MSLLPLAGLMRPRLLRTAHTIYQTILISIYEVQHPRVQFEFKPLYINPLYFISLYCL